MTRIRALSVIFVLAACAGPEGMPTDVDDAPMPTGVFSGHHAAQPFHASVIRGHITKCDTTYHTFFT